MKWYLALNEAGTRGDIALHTKITVLSARRNSDLQPHLLYTGERNDFTRWLEQQGVEILDSRVPYLGTIEELVHKGEYSLATLGHWLRTNTCLVEQEHSIIAYTDVDVLVRKSPDFESFHPRYFAAAPEFLIDNWNYINAGVMVQNVEGLREDYGDFENYLIQKIKEKKYGFHDQIAYNTYYRRRWDRLPVELNWKPYWGINDAAPIIHFHGPKIGSIAAIVEGRWNWSTGHGAQIGSLFASHVKDYGHYLRCCLESAEGLPAQDVDHIGKVIELVDRYEVPADVTIDTKFMNYRMFPDD